MREANRTPLAARRRPEGVRASARIERRREGRALRETKESKGSPAGAQRTSLSPSHGIDRRGSQRKGKQTGIGLKESWKVSRSPRVRPRLRGDRMHPSRVVMELIVKVQIEDLSRAEIAHPHRKWRQFQRSEEESRAQPVVWRLTKSHSKAQRKSSQTKSVDNTTAGSQRMRSQPHRTMEQVPLSE